MPQRPAILLILCLAATAAPASEIFVAADAADEGSGREGRPFRSIERGLAQLAPGDTLTIAPGTYRLAGTISLHGRGGLPGKPITIRGVPGRTRPVLDAGGIAKGANGPAAAIYLGSSQAVVIQGVHVANSPGHGITMWGGCSDIQILDCEVSNCVVNGIIAGGGSPAARNTGIRVAGCHIHDNCQFNKVHNDRGEWGQGIGLSGSVGAVVEDCVVERNFGEGIDLYNSSDGRMSRNVSRDNFSVLLYLDNAQRCTIERNFAISTGDKAYFRDGQPANGIVIADEPRTQPMPNVGNIIRNNVVVRAAEAFRYGGYGQANGLNTCLIIGNTFVDWTLSGMHVDKGRSHAGNVVSGNLFLAEGAVMTYFNAGPTTGFAFSGNAWSGGRGDGIQRGTGDVYANPRIANRAGAEAKDFAPLPGSPLIDAIAPVAGLAEDFTGLARPQGAAGDIGAFEAPDAQTLAKLRKEKAAAEAAAKPKPIPAAAPAEAAKPAPQARERFAARTQERAIAAARDGRGPVFRLSSMRSEAVVEGGGADDATLRVGQTVITVAWRALDDEDRAGMAVYLARSGDPADAALAGFWLRCVGRDSEARSHMVKAGPAAAEVDAAFVR